MLLLALMAAAAPPSHLPPVDECKADRTFVQFRADLRRTIDARDSKTLLSLVADDVHASLGGHVGKSDFIELWGLKQPRSSRLWNELGAALRLGCSMKNGVATAPSFQDQLDDARDPFETLIALPGAVLRRSPSDRSASVTRLRWHVLTLRKPWDGGAWIAVKLDDGRHGFVLRRNARSPIDYRAWFNQRDGRWQMAGFLAGD